MVDIIYESNLTWHNFELIAWLIPIQFGSVVTGINIIFPPKKIKLVFYSIPIEVISNILIRIYL